MIVDSYTIQNHSVIWGIEFNHIIKRYKLEKSDI